MSKTPAVPLSPSRWHNPRERGKRRASGSAGPSGGSRGCGSTSPAISGRCCACSTSSSMRGTAGNVDLAAEAIRLTRTAPCGATAGQSTLPELLCTSGQLREFRVHGFLMRSGRRRFRRAWRRRSLCLVGDWPAGGVAGPGRCHRHASPIRWAGVCPAPASRRGRAGLWRPGAGSRLSFPRLDCGVRA